jgi:hypothetical protein
MRLRRLAYVLGCALALSALALGACSIFSPDEAKVSVEFWETAGLPHTMLRVTVSDPWRQTTFDAGDFRRVDASTQYLSPTIATAKSGTLTVRYELRDAAGVASAGDVQLPLRSDWVYNVSIRPDTSDRLRLCFGCAGYRAFAIDARYQSPQADSVYVVWGGNSIKHPVVY